MKLFCYNNKLEKKVELYGSADVGVVTSKGG